MRPLHKPEFPNLPELPVSISRPLPDNWPWGRPHRHPMDEFHHRFFEGFDPKYPPEGTVVSDVIGSIRDAKVAFNTTHSVPAIFARDVQDGDIVIPIPCINNENTACNELMDALFRLKRIPDAIWVPAFRKTIDEEVSMLSNVDFDSYEPAFYGVAYLHIGRVMVGPVVAHPRYKFHTGAKLYAADNGDLTTDNTGTLVGVCLAPGSFYLTPYASTIKQLLEDYTTITVPGTATDRPLEDRFGDVVNIRDFGAVGDGVTNNTTAVNAAVAYANKLSSSACLFIPVGTYLVNSIPSVPCYGPGSLKTTGKTYSPFELLFSINGAIQKDANGRYTVNLEQLSEEDLKDLVESMLPETGGGLTTDEEGKLVIDFSQMSPEELMVILKQLISPTGGLIVGSDNKLAVDFKDLSKEDLEEIIQGMLPESGGGLETDETGKLIINFENLTKEELLTLTTVLIQEGGGLAVDENGEVYVDFTKMDTSKFEAMLRSIRVPIWVDGDKSFYVDPDNGSDTISDDIGESLEKPFKSLQACLNYIADNFNISKYTVTVYLLDGEYPRNEISLPPYNCTTGKIVIKSYSGVRENVKLGNIFLGQSVTYEISGVTIRCKDFVNGSTAPVYATAGKIQLYYVILDPRETIHSGTLYGILADSGGIVYIDATNSPEKSGVLIKVDSASLRAIINATGGGLVSFSADITVEGDTTIEDFVLSNNLGIVRRVLSSKDNPGRLPNVVASGTITGNKYRANNLGLISTGGGGPDFFPGTSAGSTNNGGVYS